MEPKQEVIKDITALDLKSKERRRNVFIPKTKEGLSLRLAINTESDTSQ
jgi:hypothetical protein